MIQCGRQCAILKFAFYSTIRCNQIPKRGRPVSVAWRGVGGSGRQIRRSDAFIFRRSGESGSGGGGVGEICQTPKGVPSGSSCAPFFSSLSSCQIASLLARSLLCLSLSLCDFFLGTHRGCLQLGKAKVLDVYLYTHTPSGCRLAAASQGNTWGWSF